MREVLRHWVFADLPWRPAATGTSAAHVWLAPPLFALKCQPDTPLTRDRIRFAQNITAMASKTELTPRTVLSRLCEKIVIHRGTLWTMESFVPGVPLAVDANAMQIAIACSAISQLHAAWASAAKMAASIPAVERRLAAFARLTPKADTESIAIYHAMKRLLPELRKLQQPAMIHPTHGDLHREHVLFENDRVAGVIDFTAAKDDHPAADLARFLGEFPQHRAAGVAAYHAAGGAAAVTAEMVRTLAQAGDVGAAVFWMERRGTRELDANEAMRFESILERIRCI